MRALCFSLVMLVTAGLQASEPWPAFRGPSANGHASTNDLPLEWSETGNVVWKTPIHGRGWSSPVVWGNRIWLTTATEDGRELSAVCIDLESGRILHDFVMFEVEEPRDTRQFNSFASPTPVIEEGRVYLSWGSYGLACLDSESADVIWVRRDLECNHWRGPGLVSHPVRRNADPALRRVRLPVRGGSGQGDRGYDLGGPSGRTTSKPTTAITRRRTALRLSSRLRTACCN